MPYSCSSCNRSFGGQEALNQHLESSSKHKKSVPKPRQDKTSTLQSQASTHVSARLFRPLQLPTRLRHPAAIVSGSTAASTRNYGSGATSQDTSQWSVLPVTQYLAALEALSIHCHLPEDLLENKYRIPPSTAKHAQRAVKYRSYMPTPPASALKPRFRAVTLDCEMATVTGGASEVILICAADYFTGAVLLKRLVCPPKKVIDWRTMIHGVKSTAMKAAISQGETLAGWEEARAEIWKFIDSDTVLVGHALHHDLHALRMIHLRVVDSAILARNAVGIHSRQWGLKTLCDELLHIEFRNNEQEVHSCLEDVLATREVVLKCTLNQQELTDWANTKRLEEELREKERLKKRQEKKTRMENMEKHKAKSPSFGADSDDFEESEMLHWSDIAEDLGWPHPDTGYDPWSD